MHPVKYLPYIMFLHLTTPYQCWVPLQHPSGNHTLKGCLRLGTFCTLEVFSMSKNEAFLFECQHVGNTLKMKSWPKLAHHMETLEYYYLTRQTMESVGQPQISMGSVQENWASHMATIRADKYWVSTGELGVTHGCTKSSLFKKGDWL